jgi:D-tyrosyl-tRNA(Tyr) deacylase
MKALLQRVIKSSVEVDNKIVGEINSGILLFIGIEKNDDEKIAIKDD